MEELSKYLKALVFLQAQAFNDAERPPKPEILLARAGLNYAEIADILGKSEAAVAKSVQRAK
jgi:DNA-directed RNA polymerase specialized sigma24 family protein